MNTVSQYISQLRIDFTKGELNEQMLEKTPDLQFEKWMNEAVKSEVTEVQAFNLSTVDAHHKPSSRILYLREFKNNEYCFFTNYQSRKGEQIFTNPHVCMLFFWPELQRQIRIEGVVARKEDADKSDDYFNSRPEESKIGAWSSPQSKVIKGREELLNLLEQNTEQFKDKKIPRPDFWGGYIVKAHYYEFWQGRMSRLHDRMIYTLQDNKWKIERLAP